MVIESPKQAKAILRYVMVGAGGNNTQATNIYFMSWFSITI
jgi:hypothetical protein